MRNISSDAGIDLRRWHTEEGEAQHGCHGAHSQRPPRAAEETCQQHGDVHGAEGAADLGDLPRQEGQHHAQRQTDGRPGQLPDHGSNGRSFVHNKFSLSN